MSGREVSIGSRVLSASLLTLAGFVASQVLRLGGNLILTRLLVPEYFGIMGIVTIVLMGVAMFSDIGIRQSVIRSAKGDDTEFLSTAWTIQCLRGLVLAIIVLLVAGLILYLQDLAFLSSQTVYGDPLLPSVLAAVSVIPLIAGAESTHTFLANRFLKQGKIVKIEVGSQLAGLIFMVLGAWLTGSVWAIVAGSIVSATIRTAMTHFVFQTGRVRFVWNKVHVREIVGYGKWIVLASISGFLLNQGDRLLLGGMVNAKMLGIYSIAYFLANAVQMAIRSLLQTVFFPVLSDVARTQPDSIADYYYRIRGKTDLIVMFVSGMLFMLGTSIVSFLYDSRYHDAGWMLEILSLSMLGIVSVVADQVFLAVGKPKWMSYASVTQTIFMYVAIPFAFHEFGFKAAIHVIALSFFPKYIMTLFFLGKLKILSPMKEFRFVPVYVIGVLVGYSVESFLSS